MLKLDCAKSVQAKDKRIFDFKTLERDAKDCI